MPPRMMSGMPMPHSTSRAAAQTSASVARRLRGKSLYMAQPRQYAPYTAANTSPAPMPDMKSAPIETLATEPKTIMALLGGMIMPMSAEAVTTPRAKRSGEPALMSAG